jgi:hypothetical protein
VRVGAEEVPAQRDGKRFRRHSSAAAKLLSHDEHGVLLAVGRNARRIAASDVHGFKVAAQLNSYIQIKNVVMVAAARETKNAVLGFAVSVLSETNTA